MIDRLPTARNPTISVFEVRSIAIEEDLYILLELSIDWIGFGRSWLIRSILGAMVLGSIYVDDYRSITIVFLLDKAQTPHQHLLVLTRDRSLEK
jgi:hypothetical protein